MNKYNLEHIELEVIKAVLRMTNGKKSLAAKILGITLKTLYNKLHENNLMNKNIKTGGLHVTK